MDEWLNLIVRWVHITAGIAWIGSSFFFIWLENHFEDGQDLNKSRSNKDGEVIGQLWMVHGGGYYHILKKQLAPGQLPRTLHWVKWEAGITWLSGIALLIIVFYFNQGIYLLDPSRSSLSFAQASLLGWGSLIVSWLYYDAIWASPLGARRPLAIALSLLGLAVVTGVLTHYLSGRAAYIHVGAILGTCMVGNVWVRIIPGQRRMVDATAAGQVPDLSQGWKAKERSVHNNYITFPVLFIMISNHFPATYAHPNNAIILGVLAILSMGIKHFMNRNDRMGSRILVITAVSVLAVLLLQWVSRPSSLPVTGKVEISEVTAMPGDPTSSVATSGSGATVTVEVIFSRSDLVPKEEILELPGNCQLAGKNADPFAGRKVILQGEKLKNTFVWISSGVKPGTAGPPSAIKEVVLDQKGCIYDPRVIGIQVGQKLRILNSDPLFHNVRSVSQANPTFNEVMPQKDMVLEKVFQQPEIMVNAKCDVHPWMASYIGVVAHPYFGVTDAAGRVEIQNLPDGEYTVSFWHEVFGQRELPLLIKQQNAPALRLDYSESR